MGNTKWQAILPTNVDQKKAEKAEALFGGNNKGGKTMDDSSDDEGESKPVKKLAPK